jgi:hypothetical protein
MRDDFRDAQIAIRLRLVAANEQLVAAKQELIAAGQSMQCLQNGDSQDVDLKEALARLEGLLRQHRDDFQAICEELHQLRNGGLQNRP